MLHVNSIMGRMVCLALEVNYRKSYDQQRILCLKRQN